jgi:hypothetical protein
LGADQANQHGDYPDVRVLNGSRGGFTGITHPALSPAVRWLEEKNIISEKIVGVDIFVGVTARDQHKLLTGHDHLAAARALVRGWNVEASDIKLSEADWNGHTLGNK